MFIHRLIFLFCVLIVLIIADDGQVETSKKNIPVFEHDLKNFANNYSYDKSWQTTTERTLIRVTRLNTKTEKSQVNQRSRRQIIETIQTAGFVMNLAKAIRNTESGEEILRIAKKVAIGFVVILSLCMLCCFMTATIICIKCCCCRQKKKKNQTPTTTQIPQAIYVHTTPNNYQPQYYQQQVPQVWNPNMNKSPEARPMLPEPSAPPYSNDPYRAEQPPPSYDKLYKDV